MWTRDSFGGGGEARALARTVEWAKTPLGLREAWPEHMLSVVDLCMSLDLPAMVCWGPDLVQVYNDASCALLGPRHPAAMGQSGRECWRDLWERYGPQYERRLAHGEVVRARDVGLPWGDDGGLPSRRSFDLAFVPVGGPVERMAGILILALDSTERSAYAKRSRALAELSARVSGLRSVAEVCREAAEALRGDAADVSEALVYLFDGSIARLSGWSGVEPGGRLAPERVPLAGRGAEDPWRFRGLRHEGRFVPVEELRTLDVARTTSWSRTAGAVVLPLIARRRRDEPAGALVAALSGGLDDAAREFLGEAAEITATAILGAQAYEEIRRRCDVLTEGMKERSRFTAGLAHELRTPLNAILAHAELLLEGHLGALEEQQERHVARISSAATQLLGVVGDILDFARIERGTDQLSVRETDLRGVVDDLSTLLHPLFREAGLQFDVRVQEDLRPIRTDAIKVRQILLNLLSNAQKYTEVGGVELVVEQTHDGSVTMTVHDTGRGIEPDQQSHVFEPFRRVAQAGDREGTGLGLTVARSFARLLGGEVELSSRPGEGSTFTLRVPDLPWALETVDLAPRP